MATRPVTSCAPTLVAWSTSIRVAAPASAVRCSAVTVMRGEPSMPQERRTSCGAASCAVRRPRRCQEAPWPARARLRHRTGCRRIATARGGLPTSARAGRYARALVIASKASATWTMLATSGISVAAEPVRISLSVRPLVVQLDDRNVRLEERHAAQDPRADDGMLLDRFVFFGGQRARLHQDVIADADLADVVEERAEPKHFELRLVQRHRSARWRATAR